MSIRRRLAMLVVLGTLPLLSGCLAGLAAVQAIPMAIGSVAMANAENRSPWRYDKPQGPRPSDENLATLDSHIQRAECGNAESQFWLASTMRNGFNKSPNNVEIYKWYRLSEMGHYAPATEELAALHETMSDAELAQGQNLVSGWTPRIEGCGHAG